MILIRIKSKNPARSSVNKDQQTNVTKCEGLNYLHRLPPTSPDKELRCAEFENFYQLYFSPSWKLWGLVELIILFLVIIHVGRTYPSDDITYTTLSITSTRTTCFKSQLQTLSREKPTTVLHMLRIPTGCDRRGSSSETVCTELLRQ
jgi:hypothetical protein